MKIYELDLQLSGNLSQEEAVGALAKIQKTLEKNSAKILRSEDPAKTELSYPIKKELSAFFVNLYLEIETTQEKIDNLNRLLKHADGVLRFMLTQRKYLPGKAPQKSKNTKQEEQKETSKKLKTKTAASTEIPRKEKPESKEIKKKTETKKRRKIKLEDIDKSLEKLLEKEL